MGEGIFIYGQGGSKRRYTKSLQAFADKVLARGKGNNSIYIFGQLGKAFLNHLVKLGIKLETDKAAITDKTIIKYKDHPKADKGAAVSFKRFKMVESAVKHPKGVYIHKGKKRLVFLGSVKYSDRKVLKVVIEPNQRIGKRVYHKVKSIGVVNKEDMISDQYIKIK